MSKFKNSSFAKVTAGFVGLASGVFMLGMVAVATPAQAQTADELAAQIQSLLATISALQTQLATMQGGTTTACTFSKDLTMGSKGDDVTCLQTYLQGKGYFTYTGAKGYFGAITKVAVSAWQTANGVSPAAGYFGSISRAKYSAVAGAPATPGAPATVGTGLTVSSPVQPAASLAPESAARLPFTKVTFTAGSDGDVTVDSIVVERVGLAADTVFSGIVLLDENGTQVGIAKTLNSNHQATLSEDFVIKAGQSRTMAIAGNMASDNDTRAGQVAGLNVVAVNTSATVSGSLPITGAAHTINATLSIGSVTLQRGSVDPGSSQTKEVGTTGYTFSAVRLTAGSAEKIMLNSIRWNQTGSASKEDLANLKTYVDGTAYDVVVSSDGKYYTSTFGSGIEVDKGFSKEMSIKGDIIGGSARTIDFDLAKRTDVNVVGQLYGYGIIPPQTGSSDPTDDTAAFSSVEDPWYDAAQVTVSAGTMTVSSDTTIAAQNIAVNLSNQPLGGFIVDVKGEPISVAKMIFNLQATGDEAENITNITMVDKNGAVLAGPVDGVSTASNSAHGTITFTDTVTFPVGKTNIVLKGKLGTAFASNDTVGASTTPSSQWTTVTGQTTGNSLTPAPTSAISSLTMTVKAGALAASQATQPVAQSVIAGQQNFEFARYILDGSQSGEDIRLTSFVALFYQAGSSTGDTYATDLTGCQLFDGTKSLTTGSNEKNPTATSDQTFTFDGTGLTIPKGTSKTLSLKCNVSTSASGNYAWGLTDNSSTFTGATGLTSGQTVEETMTANATGITMAAASSGSYTVVADSSSTYNYKAVQAGTTDVPLAAFRFTAGLTEDITLRQIALQLGNTASNSPSDLVGQQMTLWNGSTQVGTAQFGLANADYATSTLTSTVLIKKGEVGTIVVKGSLIAHDANTNTASTPGNGGYGAFLTVTYDGNNVGLNGNYATGAASGATVSSGTTSDVTTNGVRVFSSVPSIEILSSGGALAAGADLYKFKVTNPGPRDIAFNKFTFSLATTGGAVTGFTLYGDGVAANTTAVNAVDVKTSGPTLDAVQIEFADTSSAKLVSAGSSKTYVLRADTAVDTASVSETLNLALVADDAYPSLAYLMGTAAGIDVSTATTTNNIIWSPSSTTTVTATLADESKLDWTNGYGLPGFPSVGSSFPVQVFTRAN